MHYKNIHIIGTSHIAKESLEEIRQAFTNLVPDIVAVELDRKRLHALFSKQQDNSLSFSDMRSVGLKGYIFALIGRFAQKKLGGMVGVTPGSEMKLAVQLARKNKLPVALIDQDIDITLRRFSQTLTWREKFRFLGDIFRSIFRKKQTMKELGIESTSIDLSKVPSDKLVRSLIAQLKKRYPNIYKVLVDERNHVMAKNLITLSRKEPDKKILVIIGAGHEEDMMKIIKKKYNLIEVV